MAGDSSSVSEGASIQKTTAEPAAPQAPAPQAEATYTPAEFMANAHALGVRAEDIAGALHFGNLRELPQLTRAQVDQALDAYMKREV